MIFFNNKLTNINGAMLQLITLMLINKQILMNLQKLNEQKVNEIKHICLNVNCNQLSQMKRY